MEELEIVCFELINAAAEAMNFYHQALSAAKQGQFIECENQIKKGDVAFHRGHKVHASLIHKEANKEKIETSILLIHAEDQMMYAESTKQRVLDLLDCYQVIYELKQEIKNGKHSSH